MAMLESEMEKLLIEQLCCDVSQWTYRNDIRTEADLWNNLRLKLNQNNIDLLDGVPLTDDEMNQVKEFLQNQAETTYKAARWLAGEHRIAQIPVVREDASKGTISLMAINNREVAGGHSSYEVINQYRSTIKESGGPRDRRFDVTLLINGLPLIHIELKNYQHTLKDAYRQIKKYAIEGKFRGLMGLVQMFVVTNGAQTRYIAANNRGELNAKFLTGWVNEHNEPVEDYLAFAKAALKIPDAHRMIGQYSVLDNECKNVILLRPYQIHAIESIRNASRDRKSGFIWHTTGSGKTLTSYTVTKNLLDIPSIDKTIFLIDRKDLDHQTSDSFKSYADSDDIDVQNTDRTSDLEKKLANKDRITIVTTIQKLQTIIRRCLDESPSEKYLQLAQKIKAKNIAFVVDECHRAVTPETKRQIEKFFSKSLWYGFTGTPIFAENKRSQKGDLARTTQELYGECLHKYTIKEAIHDGAVLGFQIQSMGHNAEQFRSWAVEMGLYEDDTVVDTPTHEIEQKVLSAFKANNKKDFYDSDEHRNKVIDYIVNRCEHKLGLNAKDGYTYEGLLTVSSIEDAQRYYQLFKQFKENGKVRENIKKLLPDFPKIAITYTVGENEDGATADQKAMSESLADYNAMFGTNWDLSTLGAYNADLNDRLARKKPKYLNRNEQLDIVIVVDRLLTGFDAPCLSTLFLDRAPMKPQHLVQAFSRTNRLFDSSKRYGQVVTMQTPALYNKLIDEALILYCNGGTNDVSAPSWNETKEKFREALVELRQIAATPDAAIALTDKEELTKFAKAFQAVDRYLSEMQVYDEFREDELKTVFKFDRSEFERLTGVYKNVIEKLKSDQEQGDAPIGIDIEYVLESVKTVEINYRYLVALIQSHMPADEDSTRAITDAEDQRISKYIEQYSKNNPKIGQILQQIWLEIRFNPESYRNKDAFTVVQERVLEIFDQAVADFAAKWGVNAEELKAFATNTPFSEINPDNINTSMGNFKAYKAAGGSGNKLDYIKLLRDAVADFILNDVKPLLKI